MQLPTLTNPSDWALFLDFDGTLVEFADHPDAVSVETGLTQALAVLYGDLDGALAIVTGREISVIDHYLDPLVVPVAGVHGLIVRDHAGNMHHQDANVDAVRAISDRLMKLAEKHDGLLVEPKGVSVALHYRNRPDLADLCSDEITEAVAPHASIEIKPGQLVFEAKPASANKGSAINALMSHHPFCGRRPVFAGDDVTDEDGFAAVNAMGGISIKVGMGDTCSTHRIEDTNQFRAWLYDQAHQKI